MGTPHDTGSADLKFIRAMNKRKAKVEGEVLRKLAVIERNKCLIDMLERQIREGGVLR